MVNLAGPCSDSTWLDFLLTEKFENSLQGTGELYSIQCSNAWAKLVAIKMGFVDGPHLRLLKFVVKSFSYPFCISDYSSECEGRQLKDKKKKRQLN